MASPKVVVQLTFALLEGVVPSEDDVSALLNKFVAGLKAMNEQHPDLPPMEVTALTVPAESVLHLSAPPAPTEAPAPTAEAPATKAAPAPEAPASKPEDLGSLVRDIHVAWLRKQPQLWPGKSPDFHALLEGDREALAALFAELRERLATFDASPEALFCPGPGDALALRGEG